MQLTAIFYYALSHQIVDNFVNFTDSLPVNHLKTGDDQIKNDKR